MCHLVHIYIYFCSRKLGMKLGNADVFHKSNRGMLLNILGENSSQKCFKL